MTPFSGHWGACPGGPRSEGAGAQRPRCSRMRRTTPGSSIWAIRRIGPLHLGTPADRLQDLADEAAPRRLLPARRTRSALRPVPRGLRGWWPVSAFACSPRAVRVPADIAASSVCDTGGAARTGHRAGTLNRSRSSSAPRCAFQPPIFQVVRPAEMIGESVTSAEYAGCRHPVCSQVRSPERTLRPFARPANANETSKTGIEKKAAVNDATATVGKTGPFLNRKRHRQK
jgi:hypothetical protein